MENQSNSAATIKAINPTHQPKVNRIIGWNIKYDAAVNEEDLCENDKEIAKCQRRQATAWEKLNTLIEELPQRERTNICQQVETLKGLF